jgi:glycyl-tRNA synthetase
MASKAESKASDIIARRGIFYQAFGVYEGVSGFYDYGPVGLKIKRNIEREWRKLFITRLGNLEIQTTDILPEIVLKASGHLATFTDPITNCEVCKTPHRADKLVEEYMIKRGMDDEAKKVGRMSLEELSDRIDDFKIKCERCGNKLGKIEKFNLMLKTQIGPTGLEVAYLRPETAQGVYIDFRNLTKIYGLNLPTGIAQIGKAYRNEISPRQQLIRMREFSQMELQFFFDPEIPIDEMGGMKVDKEISELKIPFLACDSTKVEMRSVGDLLNEKRIPNTQFAAIVYFANRFINSIGLGKDFRFREVSETERAHYAKAAFDLEVNTSYGYIEVGGTHYRTDYDLSSHAKMSGKDVSMLSNGKKVIPHVLESSWGLDRLLLSILDNSVVEDAERGWNWLRLEDKIAPYKYAILPLQKDEKLMEKAKQIFLMMQEKDIDCYLAEGASIGKRYARADEVGVAYCITIDYTTLEDDTVTIRSRDDTKQVRKLIGEIE